MVAAVDIQDLIVAKLVWSERTWHGEKLAWEVPKVRRLNTGMPGYNYKKTSTLRVKVNVYVGQDGLINAIDYPTR